MKTKIFKIIIFFILFGLILIPVKNTYALDDLVTIRFNDINMYREMANRLGSKIEEKDDVNLTITLTQQSIDEVTSISINNSSVKDVQKIVDISGIEYFTNLRTLSISNARISNIEKISNLTNLTQLTLNNNLIEDISSIGNLSNLSYLNLDGNRISNIDTLSSLSNIRILYLDNNRIENISVVANLTGLTTLKLDKNKIANIESIKDLTTLTYLNLESNKLGDAQLVYVKDLTNLLTLNLSGNQISDIENLKYLTNIKTLYLRTNRITNIEPIKYITGITALYLDSNRIGNDQLIHLKDLDNLQTLYLNTNLITDIENLKYITSLKTLYLDGNILSDIEDLKYLTNLTALSLARTNTSNIEPLKNLSNLFVLYLNNNKIENDQLIHLKDLNLKTLELSSNKITDIEVLKYITSLTTLYINNNQISDIESLGYLTSLNYLEMNSNKISDISPLANLTSLDNLSLNGNQIESDQLQYLRNLDLRYLYLNSNKISDIEDLKYLGRLVTLYLSYNQISDISPLENLTNCEIRLYYQTIKEAEQGEGRIKLPQIFIDSQNPQSEVYSNKELSLTKCQIIDGNIVIDENVSTGKVRIIGGIANGTEISVTKEMTGIIVAKEPYRKVYVIGQDFEKDGMIVKAIYTDGTIEELAQYSIDNGKNLQEEQTEVVIRATQKDNVFTVTQEITVEPDEEKQIQFKDINMYNKVIENIEDDIISRDDDTLTITMMKGNIYSTKELYLTSYDEEEDLKIRDISGIESFPYLQYVELEDNKISDLQCLSNIKSLELLFLTNNEISNIQCLENLTNLYEIALGENQIVDIQALSNMKELYTIYLYDNKIEDVSILDQMDLTYIEVNLENQKIEHTTKSGEIELPQILKATKIQESSVYAPDSITCENCSIVGDKLVLDEGQTRGTATVDGGTAYGTVFTVILKTMTNLEIEKDETAKTEYIEGEEFDPAGIKVYAIYDNGDKEEVTDYTITPDRPLTLDDDKVVIRYEEYGNEKEIEVPITVIKKTPTEIEVETDETAKTEYIEGEEFDPTGIKVYVEYDNGERVEVTDYTIEPDRPLTLDDDKVVISYEENGETKEIEVPVAVIRKTPTGIEVETDETAKTEYIEGEEFDSAGIKVYVTYDNGERVEVTDYTITLDRPLTLDDDKVVIRYEENGNEKEIEVPVTVKQKELTGIEITKEPNKTEYTEGESFDPEGMGIIAKYNNGESIVITDYTVDPEGPLSIEDTVITIKYEGFEVSLEIGENGITINPKPEDEIEIEMDEEFTLEEDGDIIYLKDIQPKTMISTVLEKIKTNGEIGVFNVESEKVEDYTQYATSNMILRITKGEKTKDYVLVVRGDVNSDGDANFTDMLIMNKHRLEKQLLSGAYLKAGEVDGKSGVNFSDMLRINKFRLEKITVL